MMDGRAALLEMLLVFGAVLGWAGWQVWQYWRWKRDRRRREAEQSASATAEDQPPQR